MKKQIYINIAVSDLEKSVKFYEALGLEKREDFSNSEGAGMKWSEEIYFMLLTKSFAKNFIEGKEIADSNKYTEAIFAMQCDSAEEVDTMVEKAVVAGARTYKNKYNEQHDFMHTTSLVDPDGHILEFFYMDMSKFAPTN